MSIFNDKALKGVTEAVAKIMGEELKGNQHKIDANKNGKVDAHDFKLLRAKKTMKEDEQLDELSKSTVKSYVMKKIEKPTTTKKDVKGLTNAYNRLKGYKPTSEAVDLGEEKGDVHVRNKKSGKELMIPAVAVSTYEKHGYFPVPGSVKEDFDTMDKYVKDKSKESSFEKKKTDKGTMYSRKPPKPETEKKVEEGFDDMDKYMKDKNKPQPSGSAGKKPGKAYGGSKQPEEKKSMTEMLELYNEHGLKVLSMMNTKSVKFGDTEVELLDADDVNGFVETVVEEVDNETFTKEVNAQKAKAEGKGKKAEVAKASVQAVKQEEVELGEARKLEGSYKNAGGHESKVYKLSGEHNEGDPYHVKLFKGGKHHEPADYFTNDKDDAHSTAKRMVKESLDERHLTAAETKEKEMNVKGMKKNLSGFKARYGDKAKSVMYATATKQAKKD
jgi:hypothetical protein